MLESIEISLPCDGDSVLFQKTNSGDIEMLVFDAFCLDYHKRTIVSQSQLKDLYDFFKKQT